MLSPNGLWDRGAAQVTARPRAVSTSSARRSERRARFVATVTRAQMRLDLKLVELCGEQA
jgi:hypothetical protein